MAVYIGIWWRDPRFARGMFFPGMYSGWARYSFGVLDALLWQWLERAVQKKCIVLGSILFPAPVFISLFMISVCLNFFVVYQPMWAVSCYCSIFCFCVFWLLLSSTCTRGFCRFHVEVSWSFHFIHMNNWSDASWILFVDNMSSIGVPMCKGVFSWFRFHRRLRYYTRCSLLGRDPSVSFAISEEMSCRFFNMMFSICSSFMSDAGRYRGSILVMHHKLVGVVVGCTCSLPCLWVQQLSI